MKICAYVQEQYAKANYKNECVDTRQFVGLSVVVDALVEKLWGKTPLETQK